MKRLFGEHLNEADTFLGTKYTLSLGAAALRTFLSLL